MRKEMEAWRKDVSSLPGTAAQVQRLEGRMAALESSPTKDQGAEMVVQMDRRLSSAREKLSLRLSELETAVRVQQTDEGQPEQPEQLQASGAVEAADGSAGDTTTTQGGEEGDYETVPAAASEQLAQWQESHSARLKSLEQGFSESVSELRDVRAQAVTSEHLATWQDSH
eukprot:COSAG04_NODE_16134_length_509_cov_0.729268_1_plen_169_part_11